MASELLTEHGYRQDGRKPNQIRNINCQLGVYRQADGSAYLEQGNTKVLAAVYGPHEPKQRSRVSEERCIINCQYSMATFSTSERKLRPRGDRKSAELTRLLEITFESVVLTSMFPRSQLDIYCEVLQSDGGQLACCVNAASLALVDAGVPMVGVACASNCGAIRGSADDSPCIDLNGNEENLGNVGRITVAVLPVNDALALVELDHRLHQDQLPSLLDSAIAGARQVHSCFQTAIRQHVSRTKYATRTCVGGGGEEDIALLALATSGVADPTDNDVVVVP